MLRATRHYLRAVGSIFDIMPATDYLRYVPDCSDRESMHRDLKAIGADMTRAINVIRKGSGFPRLGVAGAVERT